MRTLQYGTHQAFWECQIFRANEDGYLAVHSPIRQHIHVKRLARTANVQRSVFSKKVWQPAEREPGGNSQYNWAGWYRMIEDYTARDITKPADWFPAVAGLAKEVVRVKSRNKPELMRNMTGEYMAGLWKSGVLEGLFWCKAAAAEHRPEKLLALAEEYVALSWSWASAVGQIQFPVYGWYEKRAAWRSNTLDFEPLAEYVSHVVELRDHDPFGRLTGGTLMLKAPLLPINKIKARQHKEPPLNDLFGLAPSRSKVTDGVYQLQTGKCGCVWIEGGLDVASFDRRVEAGELVAMLLIRVLHALGYGFVDYRFGLLLKRLGDGCFRRVGFIDGAILKETGLPFFKSFEIVGYPRPYQEGDMDSPSRVSTLDSMMDDLDTEREAKRHNQLALDPLELERQEVTVC